MRRYHAFVEAKKRAVAAGVPFEFDSLFDLPPEPEFCPVLGIALSRGGDTNSSPSLDRVDPRRGYTHDNTVWISQRANRIKSNAGVSELYAVADWVWEENKKRGYPNPPTRLKKGL